MTEEFGFWLLVLTGVIATIVEAWVLFGRRPAQDRSE